MTPVKDDIVYLRRFPHTCDAEVSRRRVLQPCEKTAVAVALDEDGRWWPVCAHHARGRSLVTLAQLIDALTTVR